MTSSAFGNRTGYRRLGPVSSLQVEYDEVREVCPVLILASKDEEFIALV
jgi:hypothetical protein